MASSSSSFPKQLHGMYLGLHEKLKPLNDSKFFAGLIVVLLNLGSKLVDVRLSKPMQSYFKNSFSRQALLFAMIWMPTRDVLAALIVSTIIIFSIDCLMNDESRLCVLPASFTQHHHKLLEIEAMTSSSSSGASGASSSSGGGAAGVPGELADLPGAAKLQKEIDAAIHALENARTMLQKTAAAPVPANAATSSSSASASSPAAAAPSAAGAKWYTPIAAGSF